MARNGGRALYGASPTGRPGRQVVGPSYAGWPRSPPCGAPWPRTSAAVVTAADLGLARYTFPSDPDMQVSPETIYRSLFVQSRGVLKRALRNTSPPAPLSACARRRSPPSATRPDLDAVSIRQRPADVADRAVPGHWEGDLLEGARGTYWRRSSTPLALRDAGALAEQGNADGGSRPRPPDPAASARAYESLTWDRGTELAAHRAFTMATECPGLLLRPAESLATRLKRKHQWPAAPISAARGRPFRLQPSATGCHRIAPEYSPPNDAGISNASG